MDFKIGNFGFSIGTGLSTQETEHLGNKAPDQSDPKGYYVYGHYDQNGKLFYVGKGIGRRAWSTDRHPTWARHVHKHLNNQYIVKIIADDMTENDAETKEESLISLYGSTLVNWINFGRQTDFKLLEKFHALRDANRKLIQETKTFETTEPDVAIERYLVAVDKISEYAFMDFEQGLVGQLLKEEADEEGRSGELEALDRLTMCLCKQGKGPDAQQHATNYFIRYKKDLLLKGSEKINKRIEKVLVKK